MTPTALPTVTLPAHEAAQLALLSPRGSFSCSPTGDIWPKQTAGYHRPAQRTQLRGCVPVLDRITNLVLAHRPAGGRFLLEHGTLRLAAQRRAIATLQLTQPKSLRPTAA